MNQGQGARILVAEYDWTLANRLSRLLSQQGYLPIIATTAQEAFAIATEQKLDMAILDARLPDMDGNSLVRRLRQHPASFALPILLLRRDNNTASKIAVIEAGANDHITQPFYPDALIYRVKSALVRAEAPSDALIGANGRTIAFFGAKGGVGTTTLAVNFAIALHQRGAGRVSIFDADFSFGDIGVHLDLARHHSVLDLVKHITELEPSFLEQVLINYRSALRILLGPPLPEQAELVTGEHIKQILQILGRFQDYVIIDTATSYSDQTLNILESADDIMLVTTPEVSAIRNTSVFIDLATRLKIPLEKVHIVLNRANSNQQIGVWEIERTLQHPIEYTTLSSGQVLVRSLTSGVPLVLEQPNHPFAQQVLGMADRVLNRTPQQAPQGGAMTAPLVAPAPPRALQRPPAPEPTPVPTPESSPRPASLLRKIWQRVGQA